MIPECLNRRERRQSGSPSQPASATAMRLERCAPLSPFGGAQAVAGKLRSGRSAAGMVSSWTSRPTNRWILAMCWSPVLEVWVDASTLRLGSLFASNPRFGGPALLFPYSGFAQL